MSKPYEHSVAKDGKYLTGFFIVAQLFVMALLIKLEIDSARELPTSDGFSRNFGQFLSTLFFYAVLLFAGIVMGIILRTWKLIGLQLFLPVVGLFTGLVLAELCRR